MDDRFIIKLCGQNFEVLKTVNTNRHIFKDNKGFKLTAIKIIKPIYRDGDSSTRCVALYITDNSTGEVYVWLWNYGMDVLVFKVQLNGYFKMLMSNPQCFIKSNIPPLNILYIKLIYYWHRITHRK